MILPDAASLREQYPALWQLFGGYFHQDWHLDDDTHDGVLRRWPAEDDLEEIHERLGSSLWPPGVGHTTRSWLVHVGEFLTPAG